MKISRLYIAYLLLIFVILMGFLFCNKIIEWIWSLNSDQQYWKHVKINYIPRQLGGIDSAKVVPDNASELEYIAITNGLANSVSWKCKVSFVDFSRFAKSKKWEIKKLHENVGESKYFLEEEIRTSPEQFYYLSKSSAPQIEILYDPKSQILYGNFSDR